MALAWHFTTFNALKRILESGKIKSRELLVSETLQRRPDWEDIRTGRKSLQEVLPQFMIDSYSFLRREPIVNFSRQQFWEKQAGEQTENKYDSWPADESNYVMLSMMESYRAGGGLARLGVAESKLLSWEECLFRARYPLKQALLAWLYDRKVVRGINAEYVMGFVGDAFPLSEVDAVEVFLPDNENDDDGKGMWMPLRWPSMLAASDFIKHVETMSAHWSGIQKTRRETAEYATPEII